MRPLFSAFLLSALVACTPGLEDQVDDLADELDELADKNDDLAEENAALAAQLAELLDEEDTGIEAPDLAPPFVRVASEDNGTSTSWAFSVYGEGVTSWEIFGFHYNSGLYDPMFWERSTDNCVELTTTEDVSLVWIYVWQGDVFTCHMPDGSGCEKAVTMPYDEFTCPE